MFQDLYTTLLVQPLYNGLVFLAAYVPGHDLGMATIILTIIVRFILYPLSKRSAEAQQKMRLIEPKMKEIRESIKDKQEQGVKMIALYKENKLNPLSGVMLLLIQLPIIFALYWVFHAGVGGQPELLYSFVKVPAKVSTLFLGFFDVGGKSILLALLVGVSQYMVMQVTMPKTAPPIKKEGEKASFGDDFSRSMQFQMRYLLPPFIAFIAYGIGGAISLYWITSNIFQILQELSIRRRFAKNPDLGTRG